MAESFVVRVLEKAGLSCLEEETPSPGFACLAEARADELTGVVRVVARTGFFIESMSAVDRVQDGTMAVLYIFNHYDACQRLQLRVTLKRQMVIVPSITKIFPGALWYERELAEMFDIRFDGCPDTRNLLLPEEATYHPLRKDFQGVQG